MKTLVNKANPQIRITAPEIEEITTLGYTNYEIAREGMFPLLFNPKEWTLVEEGPGMELENYISNKLRELGADLINHKPYSFNRGLNVGEGNAYQDILDRLKARKEE